MRVALRNRLQHPLEGDGGLPVQGLDLRAVLLGEAYGIHYDEAGLRVGVRGDALEVVS